MDTNSIITELVSRWQEQRKRGQKTLPEDMCRDTPELLERFRAELIIELICEWEERHKRGEKLSPTDLCGDVPSLLAPFCDALQKIQFANILLEPATETWLPGMSGPNSFPAVEGFEILAELGRGGMGVVYKARQLSINRVVALKMIRALDGRHIYSEQLTRFSREAEAVARLDHPHILRLYEFGTHGGLPYFTLEFMEGGSLAQKIAGARPSTQESARIVQQLASGAAEAHKRGIIHRDLKPDNVLLAIDGTPKIADFGIAKQFHSAVEGDNEHGLTEPGRAMGTRSYMSPEQTRGDQSIGPATDVWALGAILYRLLTGHLPFPGEKAHEVIKQVLEVPPVAPSALVPNLPRDLETICLKCLHKEAHRRYATAHELAEDLERYLTFRPIIARPIGSVERGVKWVQRNPAVAAMLGLFIVTLIAGAATSIVYALRSNRNAQAVTERAGELAIALQKAQNAEAAERQRAADLKKERDDKDEALLEAERNFNNTNIVLAESAWNGNASAGIANSYLDAIPVPVRNFEWHYLKRKYEGGLFTLYGHSGAVFGVAVGDDGTRIVSGSADKSVRVWDARTGAQLLKFDGHTSDVECVAINGKKIASGSKDKTVRVWDAESGQQVLKLEKHTDPVYCVAISSDGTRIVSGSFDKTVRVWDGKTGAEMRVLEGHTGTVSSLAINVDGTRIVSGSADKTVRLWDGGTGKTLREWKVDVLLPSVAFSADGTRVFSTDNKSVQVWDVLTGQEVRKIIAPGNVYQLAISGDAARVAGSLNDDTIRVWDAGSGVELFRLKGHRAAISALAFRIDGTRLVSGSWDNTVRLWDGKTGGNRLELTGDLAVPTSVAISDDGMRIVSGEVSPKIWVWDAKHGKPLHKLQSEWQNSVAISGDGTRVVGRSMVGRDDKRVLRVWAADTERKLVDLEWRASTDLITNEPNGVAISRDGKRIVTGADDHTVRVLDAETGQELLKLMGHSGKVECVAISGDGTRIVSGSWDKTVRVWDAETGLELIHFKGPPGRMACVTINSDGTRIAAGSIDNAVHVWDVKRGQKLFEMTADSGIAAKVMGVAINGDGTRIIVGTADGTLRLWDAKTGQKLLEWEGRARSLNCVAISGDGTRIVAGFEDMTLRIWGAHPRPELLELKGHTREIKCVALSGDGTRIVSGSRDRTARVWDLKSRQELLKLEGHLSDVTKASFSADGAQIVSEDEFGRMIVWDSRTGQRLSDEPIPTLAPPARETLDGRYFLSFSDKSVLLVPTEHLRPPAEETARRIWLTR